MWTYMSGEWGMYVCLCVAGISRVRHGFMQLFKPDLILFIVYINQDKHFIKFYYAD